MPFQLVLNEDMFKMCAGKFDKLSKEYSEGQFSFSSAGVEKNCEKNCPVFAQRWSVLWRAIACIGLSPAIRLAASKIFEHSAEVFLQSCLPAMS